MPTLTSDINSSYWSLSLEDSLDVVQEFEDLKQQVLVALTTDRGSVPFDPLFGFNINELLDEPVNFVIPNGKIGILETLERDVPIVSVDSVSHKYEPNVNYGQVTFLVFCSSNLGNFTVQVSLNPNFTPAPQGPFSGGFSVAFQPTATTSI